MKSFFAAITLVVVFTMPVVHADAISENLHGMRRVGVIAKGNDVLADETIEGLVVAKLQSLGIHYESSNGSPYTVLVAVDKNVRGTPAIFVVHLDVFRDVDSCGGRHFSSVSLFQACHYGCSADYDLGPIVRESIEDCLNDFELEYLKGNDTKKP
jgi:hypothetical protein